MPTLIHNPWPLLCWHQDFSRRGTGLLSIQAHCVASPGLRAPLQPPSFKRRDKHPRISQCTQVLTSHSCTGHSNSMCYSLLSAGTCCLRCNKSPAKKEDTDFYTQYFSVVWIILLTTKKQLLQCQVLLPVVQKDPEIPKPMTAGQKDTPELPFIQGISPWASRCLHYGDWSPQHWPAARAARVFKHFAALPGVILLRPRLCSCEMWIPRAVTWGPWVLRDTP